MKKLERFFVMAGAFLIATSALAQTSPSITSGTNSNAAQSSNVTNTVSFPSGGASDVTYHGSYDVRTPPTVYAPGLTASMSETCWGSVSAAVSVVGVGATAGGTIKDLDCNRRLNAAVAWRMDRKDIAFNIMCQQDDFRSAAALTDHPCIDPAKLARAKDGGVPLRTADTHLDPKLFEPTDPLVRERDHLPPLPVASNDAAHLH